MGLVDQMWQYVQAVQDQHTTPPPPRPTDIWLDLAKAQTQLHEQAQQIANLTAALDYLAGRLEKLEGTP